MREKRERTSKKEFYESFLERSSSPLFSALPDIINIKQTISFIMNSFNYCTIYVLYYTIKVVVYFCNFIQKIKTTLAIKLE